MNRDLLEAPGITRAHYSASDLRMGALLTSDYEQSRIVLLGFPTDEGVSRNGGRPGAAHAPDRVRESLFKLCPDPRSDSSLHMIRSTCDLGNIKKDTLEQMQEALGEIVAEALKDDKIPVIIGGGHETAYGHFLGYVQAERSVSIVNLDAHPDVRPLRDGLGHSGSPFRQALEHPSGRAEKYAVLGLQPQSVARTHLEYLKDKKADYNFRDEYTTDHFRNAVVSRLPLMATFDMDVVDSSSAPGVSAPCSNGLASGQLLDAMHLAGLSPNVHSIDVVEVNPTLDIDNRTARLAALGIWNFIRGVSRRKNQLNGDN